MTTSSSPIAVITGGAAGIGLATAKLLFGRGWTVHVLDRSPANDDGLIFHYCDVTSEEKLLQLADDIGPIDAVVTAAGINLRPNDGPAERLQIDAWNQTLAVNLTGTMLTVRAFERHIVDGGAIVTIGSIAGLSAMPWADGYTASKGAVIALTRSWAVDYGRRGVRVNCVCPGATETAMMSGVFEAFPEDKRQQLPQQRMATVEEVSAVIAFLASRESLYLSGAIVPVDGGASAHTAGLPFPRRRGNPS
jgi:3-oxoacyl-[acyl-carrier protein] reductase